LKLSLNKNKIK